MHSAKETAEETYKPESFDPNEMVSITVGETETFWIFDQQPFVMSADDEFADLQRKRNEAYTNVRRES